MDENIFNILSKGKRKSIFIGNNKIILNEIITKHQKGYKIKDLNLAVDNQKNRELDYNNQILEIFS